jgi:hypothetical protein
MNSIEKREIEELREAVKNRPTLISGESFKWPCCMLISIAGQQAKDIFDKMPDSTKLDIPAEGLCFDVDIIKIAGGTVCMARRLSPDTSVSYSCDMAINYSTGATEKMDPDNYLHCGED